MENENKEKNNNTLKWAAGIGLVVIIAVLVIVFRKDIFKPTSTASLPTNTPQTIVEDSSTTEQVVMPEFQANGNGSVARMAQPYTASTDQSGFDVIQHEVQVGDNVFSIAETYGLEPETILWSNYDTLQDNPRVIYEGQMLNILPTNGIYYEYRAGESLTNIAREFEVPIDAILDYPGNHLDPYEIDPEDPAIADGTWLIIPGGVRELQDWGPPAISRSNPAVASYYGSGSCGEIYEGPIGDGVFIWPAVATYISGYNYSPGIHEAIDIGGVEGSSIFAADSGVVVYSGWSEYGYGNMVVIDHGNGWQTAYAHLQYVSVGCGAAVYRGDTIGALGTTGNSTGPHLHFEMKLGGANVNPLGYVFP